VLVIAARKGEFETGFEKGGQTREHIQLAKTAGVKQLVVAINKMDDKTVEWSKERYDECVDKLTPFMKASGFRPKKDCYWLPISALGGTNIRDQSPDGVCPWYS
jgi:peptide chain release factor subunit 3